MRRLLVLLFASLVILLLLVTGFAAWAIKHDTFLKDQLTEIVQERTGRELIVDGPLEIHLGRKTTIAASRVALENASWGGDPAMLRIGHVQLTIDLPGLFKNRVKLDSLIVRDCRIEIRSNDQGESNWDIMPAADQKAASEEPGVAVSLLDLAVERCELTVDGPRFEQEVDIGIALAHLRPAPEDRLEGVIKGRVNEDELEFEGWLGPLGALTEGGKLEHQLNLALGSVTLESSGSVADAATWSGPDISTRFSGPEIRTVLTRLGLPALSEGAFDFRANLSDEGDLSRLEIDGGLGNLYIDAAGSFDRLKNPSRGHVRANVTGPDLGALAEVFDLKGVVREPFKASTGLAFGVDAVGIENGSLETDGDRLTVDGSVRREEELAGTKLTVGLSSHEIGRWAPVWGEESRALGAIEVDSQLAIETGGLLRLDARARHGESELAARGVVASLFGPPEPDLDFEFRSDEAPWLASLLGYHDFPNRPLAVSGHLKTTGSTIRITGLDLSLDTATASGNATVVLEPGFDGSGIDAQIDIPDIGELGSLFGVSDLPRERLQTHVTAQLKDAGLVFEARDGSFGENRIDVEGHIADLKKPALLDANFDVRLPGLQFIRSWMPDLNLPDGQFEASGSLRNQEERVDVEQASITFNNASATVDGYFTQEKHFDLKITAKDPQAANLKALTRLDVPDLPLSVSGHTSGSPSRFIVQNLDISFGKSAIAGDLSLELGEKKKISGELHASLIDMDWLEKEKTAEKPKKEKPKSRLLFDDTPVRENMDTGIEIDSRIRIDDFRLAGSRYEDLEFGIFLSPQRLELNPFKLKGFRGGSIDGVFVLFSEGERPRLEVNVEANGMKPGLAAVPGQDPATLPTIEAKLDLHSSGRTHRELAAGLNGKIRVNAGQGQVARSGIQFLLNDFVDQLLTTLNPFATQSDFTQLECAVAAADIVDGQVRLDPVVIHLREITILSQGNIDLDDESIDIDFVSKPRRGLGISAGDLVNPFIRVGGTLARPSLALDAADTVVRGGLAVATGGLSILADSLAKRFLSSRDPCGKALKEIDKRDSE